MTRTLIVGEGWSSQRPGGLNRYVADLATALRAADWPATTMVIGPHDVDGTATEADITVSTDSASVPRRLLALVRAARSLPHPPVLVDAHFALYAFPLVLGPLRRCPLVVHFHGPWVDESVAGRPRRPGHALKRAVESSVYRRAARVVVLSEAFATLVVARFGVAADRVQVVPPGVDLARFTPATTELQRAQTRATLGFSSADFVVVTVRRLEHRMGVDTLLSAWADVQRAVPQARLVIAGDGSQRAELAAACQALPRPTGVQFTGSISDHQLVDLYQAADCSVVPSRALEGFGLVVLESLACGTPAIVTDVGGLPAGVLGLDPTLVVGADLPTVLSTRIIAAARGTLPDRDQCRQHAERFSLTELARRTIAEYQAALGHRRRVVFVGHAGELSGAEQSLVRLLPYLDVDAHVILAEHGPLVAALEQIGIPVEVLAMDTRVRSLRRDRISAARLPPSAAFGAIRYAMRLRRRLRQLHPDIVHTTSGKAHLYGGVAGRLARVPVVWHLHDRIASDYLPQSAVRLVRLASRLLPAAVVANSLTSRSLLPRSVASRTTVAYPGLGPTTPTSPRLAHDGFCVGIVGRLSPWKGQHVLLDAFAAAFPDGNATALVIGDALFGETEYADGLRRQATQLGVGDRVQFTGHVPDPTPWYSRMDVLVHASTLPEPFGQVVVEGMAAGLPVIATNAGGPTEVITDEIDGLLVAPGNVGELAALLQRLAADAHLRDRLGRAAQRRARDFTLDRTAAAVMSVYDVVGPGRRGR